MAVLITGWLGLAVDARAGIRPTEVAGLRYSRQLVSWSGHPMTDMLPSVDGIERPYHAEIRIAAIFDEPKGGRCLCWFRVGPPIVEIPWGGLIGRHWPGREVSIQLDYRVQLAVSAARGGDTPDLAISEGNSFATAGGMPVIAACRLVIERDTGRLVASAAAAKEAAAERRQQRARRAGKRKTLYVIMRDI